MPNLTEVMDYDPKIGIRHCETEESNATCPYLKHGCKGCTFTRDGFIQKWAKVPTRPLKKKGEK